MLGQILFVDLVVQFGALYAGLVGEAVEDVQVDPHAQGSAEILVQVAREDAAEILVRTAIVDAPPDAGA